MSDYSNKDQYSGFTLIELLVGMTLGLVVIGGVIAVFSPSVATWRMSNAISTLQDVEQISHDVLGRKIRQASLMSCGSNANLQSGVNAIGNASIVNWAFNFPTPYRIYGMADANIPGDFGNNFNTFRLATETGAAVGTTANTPIGDVFYALSPDGTSSRILNTISSAANIVLNQPITVTTGDLFLVHDCANPVVLRASAPGAGVITTTSTWRPGITFPQSTVVSRFEPTLFYLGALAGGGTALIARTVRRALNGGNLTFLDTPVVSGVVNMRVEYGIDALNPAAPANPSQNAMVTQYLTAPQFNTAAGLNPAINIASALTTRVTLMIESDQTTFSNTQTTVNFPASNGTIVNCASTPAEDDACPSFVNFQDTGAGFNFHKVVSFTFRLSRQQIVTPI